MLREAAAAIKARLEAITGIKCVEYYEGQFESFDEQIVNPPHIYIDFQDDTPSAVGDPLGSINLRLYLMCTSVERDPGNMLDILETVMAALHNKGVRVISTQEYIGRCFYKGSKPNTTYPGLVIREANFLLDRSEDAQ